MLLSMFLQKIEGGTFNPITSLVVFVQMLSVPWVREWSSAHVVQIVGSWAQHFCHLVRPFPIRATSRS